jgi:hypothetical protein
MGAMTAVLQEHLAPHRFHFGRHLSHYHNLGGFRPTEARTTKEYSEKR